MTHDHHVPVDVTVKFTLVRHGESLDNLRSVWAGWRDSDLSNHGKAQAEALARSYANTSLTVIYTSPLKRAYTTAEVLQNAQAVPIPLYTSPLLREQNFGRGEGQPYHVRKEPGLSLAEHIAKGKYPATHKRSQRFPDGESLDDVARRADQVVRDILLPYVSKAVEEGTHGIHVVVVSHGIFIGELIASLLRLGGGKTETSYRGLRNTGRVLVTVTAKRDTEERSADTDFLRVRIVQYNACGHLDGLVRQKGGIGSAAYDPNQKDIRSFFQPVKGSRAK
ncbi:putative phosphoglycerate mutase-like protein [Lyophyllum shimeji]|uniref:Phosphoglycerate mutase-like protein n=1 Tax=Lyophyllum shimeji TaxID=47721 RepID=A0A9P3PMT1_LYOSH|nr:putative phosphoglycerate mutase-like protein [Lyophyllum shimeji]